MHSHNIFVQVSGGDECRARHLLGIESKSDISGVVLALGYGALFFPDQSISLHAVVCDGYGGLSHLAPPRIQRRCRSQIDTGETQVVSRAKRKTGASANALTS